MLWIRSGAREALLSVSRASAIQIEVRGIGPDPTKAKLRGELEDVERRACSSIRIRSK